MVENAFTSDPLIGTVIHNYVIRKRLSEGGMGAVYLAEYVDSRGASRKVIKFLLPEYSRNQMVRERFEQEAFAAMGLKNPYIVKVDNFGSLPDGQLYLMMDFIDGETLEDHLQRRGRCSMHHTLHVIAQVMSALMSLHEAKLVHRDLKPANIFLVATEQNPYEVRVIDLGIARNLAAPATKKKTMTGAAVGTPGYMAVEQYENAASATPAADVYAAAVIVWRMLFGETPWGDVYDQAVLYFRQRTEQFAPPANHEVPAEVVALLRKALSPEPTERPSVPDFVNLFASYTPAVPPFVPSGAMILERVAPRFLKHASVNDETVRNLSHASVAAPISWPHRGTELPRLVSAPPTAVLAIPTPVLAPTVNERPIAAPSSTPTTLGASSGVMALPPIPRSPWRARVLVAAGASVAAGVVAFAIAHVRHAPESAPNLEPARPSPAAASSPEHMETTSTTPTAPAAPSRATMSPPAQAVPPVPPTSAPPAEVATPKPAETTPRSAVVTPKPATPTSRPKGTPIPPRRDPAAATPGSSTAPAATAGSAAPPPASAQSTTGSAPVTPVPSGSGAGSQARPKTFDPNAIIE